MWACALKFRHATLITFAGMAELADALDLGSNTLRCAGSSPVARTKRPTAAPAVVGRFAWAIGFAEPHRLAKQVTRATQTLPSR